MNTPPSLASFPLCHQVTQEEIHSLWRGFHTGGSIDPVPSKHMANKSGFPYQVRVCPGCPLICFVFLQARCMRAHGSALVRAVPLLAPVPLPLREISGFKRSLNPNCTTAAKQQSITKVSLSCIPPPTSLYILVIILGVLDLHSRRV